MDKFSVFILSHGRADNVITYKTLRKQGYTGNVYIVVDNLDDSVEQYKANFGNDKVIIFDKLEEAKRTDTMDILGDMRIVVYARNACFRIAKELGLKYFLVLDDDYSSFCHRTMEKDRLVCVNPKSLDRVFESMIEFMKSSNALTVAFAQGGDFIGGAESGNWKKRLLRKAMNSFFCDVDRPFKFMGSINEDTNMYVEYGRMGELIFTVCDFMLTQKQTQSNKGGLTDIYLDRGTYVKSFYTVMIAPSCVTVAPMGTTHRRMHHHIEWDYCVPKIINERYKKG